MRQQKFESFKLTDSTHRLGSVLPNSKSGNHACSSRALEQHSHNAIFVITSFTEDRDITDEELLTMGQRLYDADRYRFHPWDIVMNLQNQTNKSISEDVASRKWVDFDTSGRVATLVSIYLGGKSLLQIFMNMA